MHAVCIYYCYLGDLAIPIFSAFFSSFYAYFFPLIFMLFFNATAIAEVYKATIWNILLGAYIQ